MSVTRRAVLAMGGGTLAALTLPLAPARAEGALLIEMLGNNNGAHVWFDPVGVWIAPGQTIRWLNRDAGNSHTATAYHPDFGRPQRIPESAQPWDSGYLLPGNDFAVTFTVEGVYDYYCLPHEQAGMVGRIVVGSPDPRGWLGTDAADEGVPASALDAFPPVGEIVRLGMVRAMT